MNWRFWGWRQQNLKKLVFLPFSLKVAAVFSFCKPGISFFIFSHWLPPWWTLCFTFTCPFVWAPVTCPSSIWYYCFFISLSNAWLMTICSKKRKERNHDLPKHCLIKSNYLLYVPKKKKLIGVDSSIRHRNYVVNLQSKKLWFCAEIVYLFLRNKRDISFL